MIKVRPSAFSFKKLLVPGEKKEAITFSSSLLIYSVLSYIIYLLVFSIKLPLVLKRQNGQSYKMPPVTYR